MRAVSRLPEASGVPRTTAAALCHTVPPTLHDSEGYSADSTSHVLGTSASTESTTAVTSASATPRSWSTRNARRRRGHGPTPARPARRACGPRAAFERHQVTWSRGARRLERCIVRRETRTKRAREVLLRHSPGGAAAAPARL